MLEINTWRDPYDAGFSPTRPKQIELQEGLTVLVGCNGAGKTTLLLNIEDELKDQKIPCHMYDNLHDGGSGSILSSVLSGIGGEEGDTMELGMTAYSSSEGECIKLHLGRQSRLYREFFQSGYYKNRSYRFGRIFSNDEEKEVKTKKRVLLFDAVDSGMSVDAVVEIVDFFNVLIRDAKKMGIELYLIISANEYELARNNHCFDVNAGKYINFANYEEYRSFILKSREKKEKRIQKQEIFFEKRKQKQIKDAIKQIEKNNREIENLKQKVDKHCYVKYKIKDLESKNKQLEEKYKLTSDCKSDS